MPVNRNALIRYTTIDNCLRNRYRKWTLDDLIEACSEALYEYEGIDKGISRRTIQMDIQVMRSDKLGYNAPIVVTDKKYYSYEDREYSITNIPLTTQDLNKLTEVTEILKQFRGFSHFRELSGMVQRLEDKVHAARTNNKPVIDFEKNEHLKGLDFIDEVYKAIVNKKCLEITYQSFKARNASTILFHPYLLKEFRNRWFVLGMHKKSKPLINLALDRILEIHPSDHAYLECTGKDLRNYYKDVVGVSVNEYGNPENVVLFFDNSNAPYVLTKPIHHSQQLLEKLPHGIIVSLQVQINFELEREILGFGDSLRVISPEKLKRRIKSKLIHAIDLYNSDLETKGIRNSLKQVQYKGTAVLQNVYTRRETSRMKTLIGEYLKSNIQDSPPVYAIRQLLTKIPELLPHILNPNLQKILSETGERFFISKAIYFDKPPQSNWYVTWHQDNTINVKEKKEVCGFYGWTKKGNVISVCPPEDILKKTLTIRIHLDETNENNGGLKVIPGSHNKRLSDSEINVITQSTLPMNVELDTGGIHLMRPLLLHSSAKVTNQKQRRVIHIEFSTVNLPEGLEWAEKQEV
ncbi:WYL domain-containing protein [Cytophagaceae bacterium ABcell3]|nr:WYL domain-containing protein [Cytophagaceae bacterium ABcell3]